MSNPNTSSKASSKSSSKLNKLRAGVLGANDGIVSISSLVMGVAGATNNKGTIFTAGMAALVAGALSMAVGEYVSVSSQSDAEKMYIKREKQELAESPVEELEELTQAYVDMGVTRETAGDVALELTAKSAIKAHLQTEYNMDENEISSPMHAAVASLGAFTIGGLIPFVTIIVSPSGLRLITTVLAVVVALIGTGYMSAHAGGAPKLRAILRVVIGGLVAMAATYFIGKLFGNIIS